MKASKGQADGGAVTGAAADQSRPLTASRAPDRAAIEVTQTGMRPHDRDLQGVEAP